MDRIRTNHEEECSLFSVVAMNPATLNPQSYAGQPDSAFLRDFVTFSADVIENKPII